MSPRHICATCNTYMRSKKTGVFVILQAEHDRDSPPVDDQIWMADKWGCENCGAEIYTGFGSKAVAYHFIEGFADWIDRLAKLGPNEVARIS